MKKFALLSLPLLLLATACDKESVDGPEAGYDYFSLNVGNYYIPSDGSTPYARNAVYNLNFDYGTSTVDFACSEGNEAELSLLFTKYDLPYSQKDYANGYIRAFSSENPASGISDLKADFISADFPNLLSGTVEFFNYAKISFNTPTASVFTFDLSPVFGGETITSYERGGEMKSFSNNKMVYAVSLDVEKNKASVIFYNAKFAQEMPVSLTVVLEDVDITYTAQGYELSATDMVPFMREGGNNTPVTNFTFDSFRMKVSGNNFSQAEVEYEVAGKYSATASLITSLL